MKRIQANARYTELTTGDEFTLRGVRYRVIRNASEVWELTAIPVNGGAAVRVEYN